MHCGKAISSRRAGVYARGDALVARHFRAYRWRLCKKKGFFMRPSQRRRVKGVRPLSRAHVGAVCEQTEIAYIRWFGDTRVIWNRISVREPMARTSSLSRTRRKKCLAFVAVIA